MFRHIVTSSCGSTRVFSTSASRQALATSRKSFNKKSFYDRGKQNRKGQGSEKNFASLIQTSNFAATAKDSDIIDKLSPLSAKNLRLGEVARYDDSVLGRMHVAGSFKPHQYNELYSKPISLIRKNETAAIGRFYEDCMSGKQESHRLLLTGPAGAGKSTTLAQLQAMALSADESAILIAVPDAEALVDGSSDFRLNAKTKLYDQQMASKKLIRKLINANKKLLSDIPLANDFIPIYGSKKQQQVQKLAKGEKSLLDLAQTAVHHQTNATYVFTCLMNELAHQKTYPVFLTIDNFTAFVRYGYTLYRDASNKFLYFQKLQLVKTLLDFISGDAKFVKGGVVAATRGSDPHVSNETIDVGLGLKQPDLYKKTHDFDREFAELLLKNGGIKQLAVGKLDVNEIGALLEHMLRCDVIHNEYQMAEEVEALGQEKYIEKLAERKFLVSGNGNAKLFMDSCIVKYA